MLGIPAATIRNWEERYGTIVPERSPGGHRLYSRDQMEQLRFIAAEVSRGLSAADAHRLLADQSEGGQSLATDGRNGGTRLLVLLAERDPVAADLAEFFLRTEGYDVHLALAVGDAEEQWLESSPQLAIVELMISGGRGAELCRRLKQSTKPAPCSPSPSCRLETRRWPRALTPFCRSRSIRSNSSPPSKTCSGRARWSLATDVGAPDGGARQERRRRA